MSLLTFWHVAVLIIAHMEMRNNVMDGKRNKYPPTNLETHS